MKREGSKKSSRATREKTVIRLAVLAILGLTQSWNADHVALRFCTSAAQPPGRAGSIFGKTVDSSRRGTTRSLAEFTANGQGRQLVPKGPRISLFSFQLFVFRIPRSLFALRTLLPAPCTF